MLPPAALEFYATQQAVTLTTRNEVRRLWRRMGDDFDGSWARIGPAIVNLLLEGRTVAAEEASSYLPALMAALGLTDAPAAELNVPTLASRASDGRTLESLAAQSVVAAKAYLAATPSASFGAETVGNALSVAEQFLDLVARTQVPDAARVALGAMTTARPNLGGHVRVLNPPSCPRCAILGGRWYRWSDGFDRHEQCDCTMAPVPSEEYARAEGFIQSPMEAYQAGDIRGLTDAQQKALDAGADISRVVNAYRGVSITSTRSRIPKSFLKKADVAAKRDTSGPLGDLLGFLPAEIRYPKKVDPTYPTPEGIYQVAAGDRAKALALLIQHGYLK